MDTCSIASITILRKRVVDNEAKSALIPLACKADIACDVEHKAIQAEYDRVLDKQMWILEQVHPDVDQPFLYAMIGNVSE
eukprot:SAG31_NODE_13798_length_846_cov_1.227577_1_plen_80_part_00